MKILVTDCFDLIHYGHIAFLKQTTRLNSTLDIGVINDDYIREQKTWADLHIPNPCGSPSEYLAQKRTGSPMYILETEDAESAAGTGFIVWTVISVIQGFIGCEEGKIGKGKRGWRVPSFPAFYPSIRIFAFCISSIIINNSKIKAIPKAI